MNRKKKPPKIRQHFVPQSYLNLFSDKNEFIHCFDKANPPEKRYFKASSQQIANERYFNSQAESLVLEEGEEPTSEDAFAVIESKCVPIIREVISAIEKQPLFHQIPSQPVISASQRGLLAYFIVAQYFRTRAFRSALKEYKEKFFREAVDKILLEKGIDQTDLKLIVDYDDNNAGLDQLRMIFSDEGFKTLAVTIPQIWTFHYNSTDEPFYTSDNPVVNYMDERKRTFTVFPLSTRCALSIYDPQKFPELAPYDGTCFSMIRNEVFFFNMLQVDLSFTQIYCCEPKFEFITEFAKQKPELFLVAQENRNKLRAK